MKAEKATGPITSTVVRGLAVLEALANTEGEGAGLTDVSAKVGLDKATTARLLNTLCATGFAYQDPETRKYRLTAKILALGAAYRNSIHLPNHAARHLSALREATGETVHLGILEMDHIVYIAKLESTRPVQIASAIGQTMPVHTTALGKAILSVIPPARLSSLLEGVGLPARTDRSITSVEGLHRELEATRERGYSIDDRENEETIICVGAAIVDTAGEVHGAISVSGPSYRMEDKVSEYGDLVRRTADDIGGSI